MTDKRVTSDGSTIYNLRHSKINRDNGYLRSENNFTIQKKDGEQKKIKNRCSLQIYTMNELKKILSRNRFKTIEQYKIDAYTFKTDDSGYSILTVAKKQ